jgi:uncharacterized protein
MQARPPGLPPGLPLPSDLARDAEALARAEGKTLSALIQDALRLVSALVFPGGRGEAAPRRIIEEKDQILIAKPILDELLEVLARKFSRDPEELARVAVFFADLATMLKPRRRLRVLTDDPDNRIIECALSGRADVVVTGDKKLLQLRSYRTVKIITLQAYLEG